ncbi:hypothetical protein SDJN03_14967, partial [Cucurbita argyrosperma subsp. sororia]
MECSYCNCIFQVERCGKRTTNPRPDTCRSRPCHFPMKAGFKTVPAGTGTMEQWIPQGFIVSFSLLQLK